MIKSSYEHEAHKRDASKDDDNEDFGSPWDAMEGVSEAVKRKWLLLAASVDSVCPFNGTAWSCRWLCFVNGHFFDHVVAAALLARAGASTLGDTGVDGFIHR